MDWTEQGNEGLRKGNEGNPQPYPINTPWPGTRPTSQMYGFLGELQNLRFSYTWSAKISVLTTVLWRRSPSWGNLVDLSILKLVAPVLYCTTLI